MPESSSARIPANANRDVREPHEILIELSTYRESQQMLNTTQSKTQSFWEQNAKENKCLADMQDDCRKLELENEVLRADIGRLTGRMTHIEPEDFQFLPSEKCSKCGKPTRYWLTQHIPLCPACT